MTGPEGAARGSAHYWDEVAEQSDGLPDGWRRHARHQHLALVAHWVGTPQGRWLKTDLFEERLAVRALLPALGSAQWIGTDIAPVTVAQARAAVGCVGVAADVRRLPFATASLDGILSTSTLDHFDDPADLGVALRELHRLLVPGGALVITLDNHAHPLIRLRNALPPALARRSGLAPFVVGHTVDRRHGQDVLEAAGFVVERRGHLLHAPHVIGTRLARWGWWEREALPRLDRWAARTPLRRWSGHYAVWLARPAPAGATSSNDAS